MFAMEKFNSLTILSFVVVAVSVVCGQGNPPAPGKKGAAISHSTSEIGKSNAAAISYSGGDAMATADNGTESRATAMAKLGGTAQSAAHGYGNLTQANSLAGGTGDALSDSKNVGGGEAKSTSLSNKGAALASSMSAKDEEEAAWLKAEGDKMWGVGWDKKPES